MADAHAKPNHDYHLVSPSPWPIIGAVSAFLMAAGAIMWMKSMPLGGLKIGPYVAGAGVIGVLYTMAAWWVGQRRAGAPSGPCRTSMRTSARAASVRGRGRSAAARSTSFNAAWSSTKRGM